MGVPQGTVLVVTPWYCMPWGPLYQYIPVPVLEASHPIPTRVLPYLPVLGIYRYPGGLYLQYKGVLPGAPPVPPTPISPILPLPILVSCMLPYLVLVRVSHHR